jgi:hypothetical protein
MLLSQQNKPDEKVERTSMKSDNKSEKCFINSFNIKLTNMQAKFNGTTKVYVISTTCRLSSNAVLL